MNTIFIILGVLAVCAGVYFFFYSKGKINDRDGDFIPDEIEDKVEAVKEKVTNVKKEVKRRAKAVKEEVADVKAAGKKLSREARDVGRAVRGKRGRKPKK